MYKIYNPSSPNKDKGYSALNPYGSLDPTSQLSPWNRFTDWLGITNNSGKATYQNQLMANQWETSRDLALEDREYNSYANQAQEMREAGLNPDFANPSAGMSDLAGQQPQNTTQPFTEELAFGQFLSNAFNVAISVASGIANIQNIGFSQDLSILGSTLDSAKSSYLGRATSYLMDSNTDGSVDELLDFINSRGFGSTLDDILLKSQNHKGFYNNFKTKRGKKIFDSYFNDYLMSPNLREDILDSIKNTTDKAISSSSKVAEFDVLRSYDPNSQLTEVSKILAKYLFDYNMTNLKASNKKAQNELDYQNAYDPNFAASAVNTANVEGTAANQATTNFKSLERDIIKDLKNAADNGNVIATALLGVLTIGSHSAGLVTSLVK